MTPYHLIAVRLLFATIASQLSDDEQEAVGAGLASATEAAMQAVATKDPAATDLALQVCVAMRRTT